MVLCYTGYMYLLHSKMVYNQDLLGRLDSHDELVHVCISSTAPTGPSCCAPTSHCRNPIPVCGHLSSFWAGGL